MKAEFNIAFYNRTWDTFVLDVSQEQIEACYKESRGSKSAKGKNTSNSIEYWKRITGDMRFAGNVMIWYLV